MSTVKTPSAPAFVSATEGAALLGVSLRRYNELRAEPWFPKAIDLGPRSLRWRTDELMDAISRRAPRVKFLEEPRRLAKAREEA
jgi:predicted DNA-binding transcriptional regulator AlpA